MLELHSEIQCFRSGSEFGSVFNLVCRSGSNRIRIQECKIKNRKFYVELDVLYGGLETSILEPKKKSFVVVFRIPDILVRYGSGSADPAPDPAFFVSDLRDANQNFFSVLIFAC